MDRVRDSRPGHRVHRDRRRRLPGHQAAHPAPQSHRVVHKQVGCRSRERGGRSFTSRERRRRFAGASAPTQQSAWRMGSFRRPAECTGGPRLGSAVRGHRVVRPPSALRATQGACRRIFEAARHDTVSDRDRLAGVQLALPGRHPSWRLSGGASCLSIRPRFAEAILRGDKTVELRRTRIHAHAGTLVVLYSSSPTRSVLGTAVLDEIIEAHPTELWPRVKDDAGVTQIEFDQYYEDASRGYGLRLRDAVPLATPTPFTVSGPMRDSSHRSPSATSIAFRSTSSRLRWRTRGGYASRPRAGGRR
ncbi:hypothetical protein OERS_32070 [Oerskovia enterophila]|uniref:ASCH domain-containing protein n=1 Tax=Oerskovia enterophila TaxID=43678 RepID=A0ABX2Y0T8_9CELL|nr:hypothetical protein OERS_32070 [Oerskovia enterophila]